MFILIGIGIIIILLYLVRIYNKYVYLEMETKNAFSDLGTFLQKRLDLIPNLVETIKGYSKHESETLEKVINARTNFLKLDLNDVSKLEEIQKYDNELTKTLRSIMALNEAYPDLKANVNYLELQSTLEKLENQIEGARRYYNATATNLNRYIKVFPNILFSNIFGFKSVELFKELEEAKVAPKVSF